MAETTGISWCDATFNCWHGCFKISDGCKNCYAESLSKRYGKDVWGPASTTHRQMMSDAYWRQPHAWNRKAETEGKRTRVFCASMADVFEDHPDVVTARERLWSLIIATPALDWLLLTKRPENIPGMMPSRWLHVGLPSNIWIGTSVEHQAAADERIPHLLRIPAKIRFLSCEPLLNEVNLAEYLTPNPVQGATIHHQRTGHSCGGAGEWSECNVCDMEWHNGKPGIHWVITGGESGPKHRPFKPEWARLLRDQCAAAGVKYFHKQNGGATSKSGGDLLDGKQYHEWPVTAMEDK